MHVAVIYARNKQNSTMINILSRVGEAAFEFVVVSVFLITMSFSKSVCTLHKGRNHVHDAK